MLQVREKYCNRATGLWKGREEGDPMNEKVEENGEGEGEEGRKRRQEREGEMIEKVGERGEGGR